MTLFALSDFGVSIGGDRLVSGVSLEIEAGEIVALAGASGSGKSLTAMTPFGLSAGIGSGSAQLDGEELVGLPETALAKLRAQHTGFVFQQPLTRTDTAPVGRPASQRSRHAGRRQTAGKSGNDCHARPGWPPRP